MGSRQFNTFGAHGSSEHVDFCHYPTLEECVKDLKENKGALLSKRCARQHCDAAPTRRTCNLTRNPCRQPPTGCTVVGVEIMDGAQSVHSFPFKGNTAFMLGNEVNFRKGNRRQFCLLPVVDLAARFAIDAAALLPAQATGSSWPLDWRCTSATCTPQPTVSPQSAAGRGPQ